jgi:predicted site-specific integrase-resolvase
MAKRVALYARGSTDGQSVENQLRRLEAVAVKEGWEVVDTFIDKGISGAKGREGRPAFDKLCKGIIRREFDMVAAVVCRSSRAQLTGPRGLPERASQQALPTSGHSISLDRTRLRHEAVDTTCRIRRNLRQHW